MKVTYLIPVTLLRRAAALLQPPERLFFVTGFKLGSRLVVLTDLVPVASSRSRVHVEPDPSSVLRTHRRLLAMGLDIEAQFHSHPGTTSQATHPSSVDLDTARRWETGAPFLGAVFSEGGKYVRFFNYGQESEVRIYGNHIITAEPNCVELPEIDGEEMPAETGFPEGLVPDGPTGADPLVESEDHLGSEGLAGGGGGTWQQ